MYAHTHALTRMYTHPHALTHTYTCTYTHKQYLAVLISSSRTDDKPRANDFEDDHLSDEDSINDDDNVETEIITLDSDLLHLATDLFP